MPKAKVRPRLGQLLIEERLITPEHLEAALEAQKETKQLLGTVLLGLNFIHEESALLPVLAGQLNVEHVHLKGMTIPQDAIQAIPAQFTIHYKVVPVKLEKGTLTVATSRPLDIHLYDEISLVVTYPLARQAR